MVRTKINATNSLFLIFMFAIIALYIFSTVSSKVQCTQSDINKDLHGCETLSDTYISYEVPSDIDGMTLMILKISIITVLIYAGYGIVTKLAGSSFTQRDAFTLIMIGLLAWFLWDTILVNILNASSLDNIAFSVGQKMGMFP